MTVYGSLHVLLRAQALVSPAEAAPEIASVVQTEPAAGSAARKNNRRSWRVTAAILARKSGRPGR